MNSQLSSNLSQHHQNDLMGEIDHPEVAGSPSRKSGLRYFYDRAAAIPRLSWEDECALSDAIQSTKLRIISIIGNIPPLYMQYFESESRLETEHKLLDSLDLADDGCETTTACSDQPIHNISSIMVALDCLSDISQEITKQVSAIACLSGTKNDGDAVAKLIKTITPGSTVATIQESQVFSICGSTYESLNSLIKIADRFQCSIGDILEANNNCRRLLDTYYAHINRLVAPNLRLSIVLAKLWYIHSVPFDDLVQEGNLGLMKAADRFISTLGVHFSAYARWWIKAYIFAANRQLRRLIHAPKNKERAYRDMLRTEFALESELGRPPTSIELSKRMNCSMDDIRNITKFERTSTIDDSLSIYDKEIDIDEFGAGIDAYTNSLYSEIDQKTVRNKIESLLSGMPDLNQQFVRLHWGLGNELDPLSVKEAADRLGISISRARAIDTASMTHIRQCVAALPEVEKEGLYMHINEID